MAGTMTSKILVVDDEKHILELARLYLTREGYEVEGVGDGAQAVARFGQVKPDLVILDIMLPGVDGLTICKEIRLLALLARHPGRVFQRSELLDLVWGYDFPGYTRTVDVHVQQVREKLAAAKITDPSIQTVWGVGYRLELVGS